jgi:AraC-like DNA-binding protein
MPLATLNGFAEQEGFAAINDLNHEPGAGRNDPVMRHLTQATLESLARPHEASGSFLDHILCAVCAHTLGNYGTSRVVFRSRTGGLAQWQERRAKELMRAGMDGNVPLSQLAQECRLSVTHFVRTFRESTGMSPHQWLLSLRIDRAKSLLEGSGLSLAEVALECGFHDQSHLTRAFMAHVGVSPGCWRRVRARGPIVDHPK